MSFRFGIASSNPVFHEENTIVAICRGINARGTKTKGIQGIASVERHQLRIHGEGLHVISFLKKHIRLAG